MTRAKTSWLLLGILCLASFAVADDTAWEKYMKAGMEAHRNGQYAEAEKQFVLIGLGVAKQYCGTDSIGNMFAQC